MCMHELNYCQLASQRNCGLLVKVQLMIVLRQKKNINDSIVVMTDDAGDEYCNWYSSNSENSGPVRQWWIGLRCECLQSN